MGGAVRSSKILQLTGFIFFAVITLTPHKFMVLTNPSLVVYINKVLCNLHVCQAKLMNVQCDLKTHDFLLPLEQVGKNVYKGKYIEKSTPPSKVEHILSGGMGTYSVSYMNQIQRRKVTKDEGIVISAAQSNVEMKNGVTWMTSMEQASQSSSIHNNPSTTFSSLSTSHPSSSNKNLYFANTVKYAKSDQEEEYIDDDFIIKKEPSFHHKGSLSVKVNTANPGQKSNSPRSKHSATEQRRRSKINDSVILVQILKLRGIIPHGEQKRDKASFLLEVIEYIQFLQDKVHKYEDSSHGWTSKPPNTIPLNNRSSNIFFEEPLLPMTQSLIDSNMINSIGATKETGQHTQPTNEPFLFPDTAAAGQHGQPQLSHSRSCKGNCTITSDRLKDEELVIESGTISISTTYSQGLSSAITEALKSSGLDLSHANISVQIDLRKRSNTNTLDLSPDDLKVP
ncbi:hypothetical protein E3N88_25566 [Mikania micrantha]|uniref:BHLH domain-containing protein n=1 Tax=Mikania micrantha TaxID=192012 RepID=A0A5N6N7X1_9ASTR|nr:hypothetical protein E3N88_25566 [Mikania micrantha]